MSKLSRSGRYDKPVPEPHFIPGYTGHCPDLHDQIGMTYPWATYAILLDKPIYAKRLSPIKCSPFRRTFEACKQKKIQTPEEEDEKIVAQRRAAQKYPLLGDDVSIGYGGHVPKLHEGVGKTHRHVMRKCIADFEREQQRDWKCVADLEPEQQKNRKCTADFEREPQWDLKCICVVQLEKQKDRKCTADFEREQQKDRKCKADFEREPQRDRKCKADFEQEHHGNSLCIADLKREQQKDRKCTADFEREPKRDRKCICDFKREQQRDRKCIGDIEREQQQNRCEGTVSSKCPCCESCCQRKGRKIDNSPKI